ncbi:MAG: hypothetical protein ACTSUO_02740 [Candidatus Thorarchaeota archaeon]
MNYKPALLLVSCVLLLLLSPASTPLGITDSDNNQSMFAIQNPLEQMWNIASAGDSGLDSTATMFMSREISDQSISVMNSFANTAHHNGTLDLSSYLISGWSLYEVTMDVQNITAAGEREIVGEIPQVTEDFIIQEPVNDVYLDILGQEFYNQPYNGSLNNYSIRYSTFGYDTDYYGYAFFAIRTDCESISTNLTNHVNLTSSPPYVWETVDGESANLTKNTNYWALIDGTYLQEYSNNYPEIYWRSEGSAGSYNTSYRLGGSWYYDRSNEALLNYTYTPWNRTSNGAFTFQSSEIELRGNTTSLTENSWTWTSSNNITYFNFDSNQSVYINHNLTLNYKKDVTVQSTWDVSDSGGAVSWNRTASLEYPSIASSNFVNLTRMIDWTPTGLYNGTSTNYNNYTSIATTVTCSNMTNGTWTMTFTAHNYLTEIDSLDVVSIVDDLSITASIEDGTSVNATDGSTNLTIWQDTTKVSSPSNETVTNGATQYLWDIDADTSNNGTYRIEVYWTNGTEAGYFTKQIVVYYPTEFGATDYTINAYTEDTFDIRVSFNDTFTPQGLDGSSSTVEYSFDGAANTTMTDHSNGTWTATISTVGKNFGTYDVDVFAEGFAIENQTLTITVSLLHDTLPLVGIWSQPYKDNITYTQSTNLTILYQRVDGTNVTDAMVNVTIDGSPYDLHYDAINEFYWIQFNGSDLTGFSTFPLTIEAWKAGYVDRTNSTLSLIVREQPTTLSLTWTATTIDYLGQIDLTVEYWYSGTAVPAINPNMNMTINGGTPIQLNQSGNYWTANLTGEYLDLGSHNIVVYAWAYGYIEQSDIETLTVNTVTTTFTLTWTVITIDYLGQIDLTVEYWYGATAVPAISPNVNLTINGGTPILLNQSGDYWTANFTGEYLDLGIFNIVVYAWEYGYASQSDTETLTVNNVATTFSLTWTSITINYIEQIDLTVQYWYGGTAVPAVSPNMNLTINGGSAILLNQSGNYWTANFTGEYLDLGTFNIVVYAWEYGYVDQSDTETLTVNNVTTNALMIVWEPTNVTIEYTQLLNLTVGYTYDSSDVPSNAWVNVTINGHTYNLTFLTGLWRVSIPGNDLELGVHDATISCWLYGYDQQSNVTTGVNITLAANSFVVEWSPSDLNLTYVEMLYINVTYTKDYQPILGATVQLIVNGTDVYDFSYNATTEKYHLTISAITLGLGIWNTTIRANKTGYDTGVEYEISTVIPDPCTATPNWTDEQIFYTHQTDLNIELLNSFGQPITDALVNATYDSSNYNLTHLGLGIYRLVLNGSDGMNNYSITVYTYRYGFINRTVSVDLEIVETPTYFDLDEIINLEPFYYDGWIIYSAYYEDDDSIPITSAVVNLILGARIFPLVSYGNGTYSVNLTGTELGIGLYSGYAFAELYGYESGNHTAGRVVESVPTHIDYPEVPSIMFINDTIMIDFQYINDHTGQRIVVVPVITWAGVTLIPTEPSPGLYRIELNSSDIDIGTHELSVQFILENYSIASEQWDITVRVVNTWFTIHPDYEEYENETLVLSTVYYDADHNSPIHWANVNVSINGISYTMVYIGNGEYVVEIHLGEREPQEYTLRFEADAEGCAFNVSIATLTILEKTQYTLTVDVGAAVEGATLGITVTFTHPTESVQGLEVIVHVLLIDEDEITTLLNQTGVTTALGTVQVNFDIPVGTKTILVWVEFMGSESEWAITTSEESYLTSPSGGIFETLIVFLQSPLGMLFLFIIVIGAIVGTAYTKVLRPKRERASVELDKQYSAFKELAALRHFMAVYRDRGTCVFYHPFTEERIEPDLISGFISAITSVYGEIKGDGVVGTLEVIQYQGLFLHNYSSENLLGILILDEEMSQHLSDRLQWFVEMFENEYERDLHEWTGRTDCFNPEWIVGNLNSVFGYEHHLAHKIVLPEKTKGREKKILELIAKEKNGRGEVFLSDLISPLASLLKEPKEVVYDKLLSIRDKGLLIPISVQNILQRQGMGLVDEYVEEDVVEPESQEEPEIDEQIEEILESESQEEPVVEEVIEEEVPPEPEVDPLDAFVDDVEGLLKSDEKDEDK